MLAVPGLVSSELWLRVGRWYATCGGQDSADCVPLAPFSLLQKASNPKSLFPCITENLAFDRVRKDPWKMPVDASPCLFAGCLTNITVLRVSLLEPVPGGAGGVASIRPFS